MGTPVPPPIILPPGVPGAACANCWGTGKPFGDGDPPSSIEVSVTGIIKGPLWHSGLAAPLDGVFTAGQSGLDGCLYQFFTADAALGITFGPAFTNGSIITFGPTNMFAGQSVNACGKFMTNIITDYFLDGSIRVIV